METTNKITSDKQFSDKLRGFKVSATAIRENLQSLIEYGLEKYKDHSDTSKLTEVMLAVSAVKTIPAKTIKVYIGEHANVLWVKNAKTKEFVFRKNGKEVKVTMPELAWYAHEVNKANDAKEDFIDPVIVLRKAVKALLDAKEAGKIAVGREDMTEELLTMLKPVVNNEPLTKEQLKAAPVAA